MWFWDNVTLIVGTFALFSAFFRIVDSRNEFQCDEILRCITLFDFGQIIAVDASFDTDPRASLDAERCFQHTKNICHSFDWNHLKILYVQRANIFACRFDVIRFECFDINVTSITFFDDHTFDLNGLRTRMSCALSSSVRLLLSRCSPTPDIFSSGEELWLSPHPYDI